MNFEIKIYDVLKGSKDGSFKKGDHISFGKDGSILCKEAKGWMESQYLEEATEGMEYGLTDESINKILEDIETDIKELEGRKKYLLQLKNKKPEERK